MLSQKLTMIVGGLTRHTVMENQPGSYLFLLGADVGHPSPGVQKPSVASLVYNIDPNFAKYKAHTALQNPRSETITDLAAMFKESLLDFMARAKGAVQCIIFYRDGVSEGEFEKVRQIEIKALNGKSFTIVHSLI